MMQEDTLKVIFLGTGTSTGVPMVGCRCPVCRSKDLRDNRTRCSVYIEYQELKLVIDTGPDFRIQLLREGIEDIDAVLYTHSHKDHIAGLDDIRPINYLKNKEIDIYATEETRHRLEQEYHYIFSGNYPGVPLIRMNIIDNEIFFIKGIPIVPFLSMHGNMPVLGFRIGEFAYLTDANYIEDVELDKIRNCRVFVINALQPEEHYSHFTLQEALEVVQKVNPEVAYLTHISHKMGLHAEMEKKLPDHVRLSYDGLQLMI